MPIASLSERLGQQFVIENRPGAGTNIATEAVVRAPADGYTLLLVTASNAFKATLYDKLNFNFIRDIAPVAGIMRVPSVMVVHPWVPAKTIPELIAYANANLGKINVASGSIGGPGHVAAELQRRLLRARRERPCLARRSVVICAPNEVRKLGLIPYPHERQKSRTLLAQANLLIDC